MKFKFPVRRTENVLPHYPGCTFDQTEPHELWSWHWVMAHKMERHGVVTLPNGNSSFSIDKIENTGDKIQLRVHRVDQVNQHETVLDANGFFMYLKPEQERVKYIPKRKGIEPSDLGTDRETKIMTGQTSAIGDEW